MPNRIPHHPPRGGWPNSRGISGRNALESVAGLPRNQWPEWRGIPNEVNGGASPHRRERASLAWLRGSAAMLAIVTLQSNVMTLYGLAFQRLRDLRAPLVERRTGIPLSRT